VRREVVRALGRIGGPAVHRPLIQALRDSDPSVLEAAIGMLGAAKVKQATPALIRFAGQRILTGKAFAARKAALAALGAMGDPGVVTVLSAVLYTRTWFQRAAGDELRQAAAVALLGTARPEAREVVEAGARSRRGDVRRACNAALQRVTTPPATKE
jgi:HEAT repeat protein